MTQQQRRKTNIDKDNRKFWLSHEVFLYLQALALQRGVGPSAFLETHLRDLAEERLSHEQRESIKQQAQAIRAKRIENAASHAQQP